MLINKIINFETKILWNSVLKKLKEYGKECKCQRGFSVKGFEYISMGSGFNGGTNICLHVWKNYKNQVMDRDPQLVIGDNVSMVANSYISCSNQVIIGDGVLVGANVFISDNMHGKNTFEELSIAPNNRKLYSKGPVVIGDNVWLGRNVCVMPNVKIGKGTIVGANAVVTHDLPENCVAVGAPARVIKKIDGDD